MFSDKKKSRPISNDTEIKASTILAEGVTVKDGNLYGSGGINISGVFFGDIDVEGVLIISDSGNVKGDIKADDAFVYGAVEGNVSVKGQVHIYAEGRIMGDVFAASLRVDDGAAFRGHCSTFASQTVNLLNVTGTIFKPQAVSEDEPVAVPQSRSAP